MADREAPVTNAVRARDELREAILAGSLPPGARLRAESLAERLQTSRTPVREALHLLAREGLVDIEPRRGAVVRQFDAADLADLYDVRALIEPYAARRAATRIGAPDVGRLADLCDRADARGAADDAAVEDQVALNEEFHRIIVAASGSPRLEAALRAVAGIPRPFRAAFWHDDAQREQSLFCHRQIVHALERRQPRLAEAAMEMHIVGAVEFLKEVIDDER
jgi:DNA-binding GntR family transcriptional regulator